MTYPEYKANRDKEAKTKEELKVKELKQQFKLQLPLIKEALSLLGVRQMIAINYEADDLAGLICERLKATGKRGVMISGDKDWVQLVSKNTAWVDPVRDYRLSLGTMENKLGWIPDKKDIRVTDDGSKIEGFVGVPSPRAWLEMKALMGDMGDNIPGVGGIGPRGAIDFVHAYGSVASFFNQCADKSIDIDKLPKKLRDFAISDEKQELYRRNMRLMDLNTTERPAPISLETIHGQLNPDAFEQFCERWMFRSITSDLDHYLAPFGGAQQLKAAA
jgi:5'-3' exonuclease